MNKWWFPIILRFLSPILTLSIMMHDGLQRIWLRKCVKQKQLKIESTRAMLISSIRPYISIITLGGQIGWDEIFFSRPVLPESNFFELVPSSWSFSAKRERSLWAIYKSDPFCSITGVLSRKRLERAMPVWIMNCFSWWCTSVKTTWCSKTWLGT